MAASTSPALSVGSSNSTNISTATVNNSSTASVAATASSTTTTPFQSLFLSATRPIPISHNQYNPYVILFQHSTKLHQRIIASEPSSKLTLQEVYQNNNASNLIIREAIYECHRRCHGFVILVQTLASPPIDQLLYNSYSHNKENVKNHVVIDLYSDPLGWDDDTDNNHENRFKGNTNNLQSVLSCIQKAAQYIYTLKQKTNHQQQQEHQQPIPIIFDSITSLLIHHGIHKFTLFLSKLKQMLIHPTSTTTETSNDNAKTIIITSPIFIPNTIETTPSSLSTPIPIPQSNQILEEYVDVTISLYHGKLYIIKRGSASIRNNGGMIYPGFNGGVRLMKHEQNFKLVDSDSGGMGKSIVFLNSTLSKRTIDAAPASSSTGKKMEQQQMDEIDGQFNKMTMNDGSSLVGAITASNHKDTTANNTHTLTRYSNKKSPIILQHEHENQKTTNTNQSTRTTTTATNITTTAPRIYMEDNDPEYDDLDEEDPDEDLDI